jgi:N,N-dimethylformamidase beta subunit-like protein
MLTAVASVATRRTFLGLAAAGIAGAAAAVASLWPRPGPAAKHPAAAGRAAATPARAQRPAVPEKVPENSLPGDPHWQLRHLGREHEIEGYTGKASVLTGESFPLFVSTTSAGFRVTAFRLGWYGGDGARRVWQSGPVKGRAQKGPAVTGATSTVRTEWDPVLEVPTDDWPPGAYLLRLDADSGAQRYVPVTVRSANTAGKIVLKASVQTWQAYNTWGGYDLYKGPSGAYGDRSRAVSLDRPYDMNGASMFLTYERNAVKLAESMGLDLAYVTSMDIAADPGLLDGASALVSMGHDEYWTPAERANVTAARDAGVNLAFLGANAMFRRTRLESTPLGGSRLVVCYKTSYTADPLYGKDNAAVTSDWRNAPHPDPESSLIGTIYEGYPVNAAYVVASPHSWVFAGTGVRAGTRFPNLVGIEYDRVDPAFPLRRPIEVLSHSPLTCNGTASFSDSAYYTHSGGAGVFNSGTMRWVEAIYGDQPHGVSGATPGFVRQVTKNVLRAFADGPAAARYPARDNLDAIREYRGDPLGSSQGLQ